MPKGITRPRPSDPAEQALLEKGRKKNREASTRHRAKTNAEREELRVLKPAYETLKNDFEEIKKQLAAVQHEKEVLLARGYVAASDRRPQLRSSSTPYACYVPQMRYNLSAPASVEPTYTRPLAQYHVPEAPAAGRIDPTYIQPVGMAQGNCHNSIFAQPIIHHSTQSIETGRDEMQSAENGTTHHTVQEKGDRPVNFLLGAFTPREKQEMESFLVAISGQGYTPIGKTGITPTPEELAVLQAQKSAGRLRVLNEKAVSPVAA